MQPAAGPWRVVRAAFVAVVCVACSVVAHVAAGGEVPGAGTVAGVCGGVGVLAYALSGRRWTFGRLLLVLGIGQIVLHPLFDLVNPPGAAAESAGMVVAHLAAAVGLAAVMAHGDLVLWRLAAVVHALLRPLAGFAGTVVVPVAPAGSSCAVGGLDLPVPTGVELAPTGERAPPACSC